MKTIVTVATLVLLGLPSCRVKDPLYCDPQTPCTDPERPYCDLNGEFPASEGVGRTCIPDPFSNTDGGTLSDSGTGRTIVQLATTASQSCAVLSDGALRCWGDRWYGELVGDNEHPREAGDMDTGAPVADVAIGDGRTCIRYVAGNVRCWGDNSAGWLGYGHKQRVDGPPADVPDLELGGAAKALTAGASHFCALLDSGDIRCWGNNSSGQLGLGNTVTVGDNEVPADKAPVDVGGVVIQVVAGFGHTCVLLEGGLVRCWGQGGSGRLGYASEENVGDSETPTQAGYVNVGGDVTSIVPGFDHTCAILDGGAVRCWGYAPRLGIPGNTNDVGDTEDPATSGTTDIGGVAVQLIAGKYFTCAVRDDHAVVCWGGANDGQLGYGIADDNVGDDETPAQQGSVVLGGRASKLSSGGASRAHTCVIIDSGDVRCWGNNGAGQLGLRHLDDVGDNETPDSQDPVQILD